jgi:uncharacterized protein YndB with AHSA1/START domain
MSDYVLSVERVIPAAPEAIFDLIADPTRHQDIDGSGTVRDAKEGSQRLALGDSFGMSMHAGFGYSMVSTVIEFEDNRRLAWQTRPPGKIASVLGGRIWRYELEPVEGGTLVRESWDLSEEHGKALVWRFARAKTEKGMTATLERIEQVVGSGAPA